VAPDRRLIGLLSGAISDAMVWATQFLDSKLFKLYSILPWKKDTKYKFV
jgi:hypothetical protein